LPALVQAAWQWMNQKSVVNPGADVLLRKS
jgi:hypothetical protein